MTLTLTPKSVDFPSLLSSHLFPQPRLTPTTNQTISYFPKLLPPQLLQPPLRILPTPSHYRTADESEQPPTSPQSLKIFSKQPLSSKPSTSAIHLSIAPLSMQSQPNHHLSSSLSPSTTKNDYTSQPLPALHATTIAAFAQK